MVSYDLVTTLVQPAQVLATGLPIFPCVTVAYPIFRQTLNEVHRLAWDIWRVSLEPAERTPRKASKRP
jgi:hypothetical protein